MQLLHNASGLPATQVDVPPHKTFAGSTRARPIEVFAKMQSVLRRLCVILGSLREHTRIQFSTQSVALGPGFELLETGWRENKRTTARAEGIRKLQAIRQTVDIADIQMFLAGFDAGEEFVRDSMGSLVHSTTAERQIQPKPLESFDQHLS